MRCALWLFNKRDIRWEVRSMAELQHKFVTTNGFYPSLSNGLQPFLLQTPFLRASTLTREKLGDGGDVSPAVVAQTS
jgi:hypothetical protein